MRLRCILRLHNLQLAKLHIGKEKKGARALTPPKGSGRSAVSVRTVLFYHFVVNTHDEKRGRPLADKESPIITAQDFQHS